MGIDLLSKENYQKIFDFELKEVGMFVNLNENRTYNNLKLPLHSRSLAIITETYYYNAVIQCLANIGPLRDIFFNRNK